MKTKIYTLVDPITDEVKYVGITEGSLRNRLNGHIKESKLRTHPTRKHIWINELVKAGTPPVILLLEEVEEKVSWWEMWWVEYLTMYGHDLYNICRSYEPRVATEFTSMFQFDLDGNFMFAYYSVTAAADAVDGDDAIIHRAAKLKNGYKAYGYQWRYALETNIGPAKSKRQPNVNTTVYQYDTQGNFIKEWESGQEAAKTLGLLKSKISNCCNGKRNIHGGFKWSFQLNDKI